MGNTVNLRTFRKRAERRREAELAAERRLAHGVSKLDRTLAHTREDKVRRDLEQHRIEPGDSQ
jgi:hypothetical protein